MLFLETLVRLSANLFKACDFNQVFCHLADINSCKFSTLTAVMTNWQESLPTESSIASIWLDEQYVLVDSFAEWLRSRQSEWFTLPPAIVETLDGNWRLAFVLRKGEQFVGVFNHPVQAVRAIGDESLARAFKQHFPSD